MYFLVAIVIVEFALRMTYQVPAQALVMTAILAGLTFICYLLADFKSPAAAGRWISKRTSVAIMLVFGVVGTIVLAVYNGAPISAVLAEPVFAFFFFLSFAGVGDRLMARIKRA